MQIFASVMKNMSFVYFYNYTNHSFQWPGSACAISPSTFEITRIVSLVTCVLSLVGNSLIVAAFTTKRLPKTPVNFLVVNMATSDIIMLLFVVQDRIVNGYMDGGILGIIICKLPVFVVTATYNVSILSMLVIAVDRFHSIVFAVRPPLLSNKSCCVVITVIWLLAGGSCGHLLYALKVIRIGHNQFRCLFRWTTALNTYIAYKTQWITLFVCFCVVPLVVMTVTYSSIIVSLYRRVNSDIQLGSEVLRQRTRENRRVTCMLIIIVVVFFVSWSPLYTSVLMVLFFPTERQPCILPPVAIQMTLAYPFFNPFVYYIFNKNYRKAFNGLLSCFCFCFNGNHCCKSSVAPEENSNSRRSHRTENTGF